MTELVLTICYERITLDDSGAWVHKRGYDKLGRRILVQEFIEPELMRYLDLDAMQANGIQVNDQRGHVWLIGTHDAWRPVFEDKAKEF
jgi:hypothetical protein